MKVAVVGSGSWGSALAEVVSRCGNEVLLWAHDPWVADSIRETRSNPAYLPSAKFLPLVRPTSSLEEVAQFGNTILMVTPSHYYREVLGQIGPKLGSPVRVISGTKGIENQSLRRISEISGEVLGDKLEQFAVLSGPTFAAEVSKGDPTTAVVASTGAAFAQEIQEAMSYEAFRLYTSNDVVGVELGGSLKNVVAIAAGVLNGLGLGFNTMAALVTRGLHETRRLGVAMGGRPETFAGLAGMGDLVLTCTGSLSRNRKVGVALGQGKKLAEILDDTKFVAEGVRACRSARDLAHRHDVEMPITEAMYKILYEDQAPKEAIQQLMQRSLKPEIEETE